MDMVQVRHLPEAPLLACPILQKLEVLLADGGRNQVLDKLGDLVKGSLDGLGLDAVGVAGLGQEAGPGARQPLDGAGELRQLDLRGLR